MSLALSWDGQQLHALLTDFRAFACHGRRAASLPMLRRQCADAAASKSLPGMGVPYELVLETNVWQTVMHGSLGALNVLLPPEIDFVPIEALGDERCLLGERVAVVRLLLDNGTASGDGASAVRYPVQRLARLSVTLAGSWSGFDKHSLHIPARSVVMQRSRSDAAFDLDAKAAQHCIVILDYSESPSDWLGDSPNWTHAAVVTYRAVGNGDAVDVINRLRRTGQAALVAPIDISRSNYEASISLLVEVLSEGTELPEAVRRVRTSTSLGDSRDWRLYHADHAPLCAGPLIDLPNEHRPLTMLRFDLVQSTRLLGTLGNERYIETLQEMHQRCRRIVIDRGGVADDPQGDDGLMCYFGVPKALEDAAIRALDAALAMQAAIATLPGELSLRVGLATGRVAVSMGQQAGEEIHLADRLMRIARPGEIIVDANTRQLAGHVFRLEPKGLVGPLKGIDNQVNVWRLIGHARTNRPRLSRTRFVGRDAELAELDHRWAEVVDHRSASLVIVGEAGIGKSRLTREFVRQLRRRGHLAIVCHGQPELRHSAFRVVSLTLSRLLGVKPEASIEERREIIDRALKDVGRGDADVLALLSIMGGAEIDGQASSPARLRHRVIESVARMVFDAAAVRPLVLLVEDLQWVDPSSLELFSRLNTARTQARFLLLATMRDEGATPLLPGVERLRLERLSPTAARWLVRQVLGANRRSAEAVRRLADRADGVPLFLEESARMSIEHDGDDATPPRVIPATLDALLMARIDRLDPMPKRIAQIAAVIGRSFPTDLLLAVLASPDLPVVIDDGMNQLQALFSTGLLRQRESSHGVLTSFRHALLRDVAYASLWQRERDRLHSLIATVLERSFPALVEDRPELLAAHLTRAGRHSEAVALWERAARRAARHWANYEAIDHLRSGLACMTSEPPSRRRDGVELTLQVMLASRLIAARGYGSTEVETVYERVAELAEALRDEDALRKALLGLESVYVMRADLARAELLAHKAVDQARRREDAPSLLQARWALANARFHRGDSASALPLMEQCLAEYVPSMHRPAAVQDPAVMCLCYSAWGLWECGRADEARRRAAAVVRLARRLRHPFSLAEAYGFAASICLFRGDFRAGVAWANRAVALCEEAGFSVWLAHARIVRGRLLALMGDVDQGLADMRDGHRDWADSGAVITRPFYFSLEAETLLEIGQARRAEELADEAMTLVERHGERYHLADLLRVKGAIRLADGDVEDALVFADRAMALAKAQGKASFVLRAAMVAGDALTLNGRAAEAGTQLAAALRDLPEGHRTRDPRMARARLQQWSTAGHGAGT